MTYLFFSFYKVSKSFNENKPTRDYGSVRHITIKSHHKENWLIADIRISTVKLNYQST